MPLANPGAIADVLGGGALDPDWGNAIRDRVVNVFANAAARDAAIVAPVEGMTCHLNDVDQDVVYDGVAWRLPWALPWGLLGYVTATANQGGITTQVDVTGLSLTITFVANRRIKLTAGLTAFSSVSTDIISFLITDAVPNTIAQFNSSSPSTTIGVWKEGSVFVTPPAGSKTYKVRAFRGAGTGTITTVAAAASPNIFYIEDCGPNGVAA